MRGLWQHPVRFEGCFPRPQESLCPFAAHAVIMDIAEKTDPVERTEHVLLLATRCEAVLEEQRLHLRAGQHIAGEPSQKLFELEVADMRSDLGEILIGDFRGGLVHDLLEAELASPLMWPERSETLADGHQVARAEQRVPADEIKDRFVFTRVCIGDRHSSQECLDRIRAQPVRKHHHVALQQAHVVEEDLAEALGGVRDIDSTAAVLLGHDGRLRKARVGFLAHGGKYLDVVIDPAKLIGDLHQAELREVPHVRRQLAGDARMAGRAFDVLVEILIDAIDEDGHRRGDRAQTWHQMAVGVGTATLQLARGELEQADEMVDDAVKLFVRDEAGQAGTDPEVTHGTEVFQVPPERSP